MRKLTLSLIAVLVSLSTFAQKKFKVENISFGIMITGALNYSQHHYEETEWGVKEKGKPVEAFYVVAPSINLETNITENRVMYNIKTNSLQTLHSYKLPYHSDVYVMFEKSLKSKEKYLGFGVEKAIKLPSMKWCSLVFFIEGGTNFTYQSFAGGIILHPQISLFRRKESKNNLH